MAIEKIDAGVSESAFGANPNADEYVQFAQAANVTATDGQPAPEGAAPVDGTGTESVPELSDSKDSNQIEVQAAFMTPERRTLYSEPSQRHSKSQQYQCDERTSGMCQHVGQSAGTASKTSEPFGVGPAP